METEWKDNRIQKNVGKESMAKNWKDARNVLRERGPEYLSEKDLLKILLGGIGEESLKAIQENYDLKSLSVASLYDLEKLPGVGEKFAEKIAATFELARRLETYTEERKPDFSSPAAVYKHLYPKVRGKKKENFIVLYLDTKNKLIKEELISLGSLYGCIVHPREVFKVAISVSAKSIIVSHNHPSGDPKPSREDILITEKLVEGGKLLGIDVLDHVVIGDEGRYRSLRDEGFIH